MGNHIGISTLTHTNDGQLVLWRQSGAAQQSRDLLAPTGSGSCDWSDWTDLSNDRLLKDLISRAMKREFREESHPLKSVLKDVAMRTAILGFFAGSVVVENRNLLEFPKQRYTALSLNQIWRLMHQSPFSLYIQPTRLTSFAIR